MLKTTGVCKGYSGRRVLNDVSLTINKGDIYGLVGKNGAGKTTIMRIMTGLQIPDKGTIEFGFDNKRLGSVGSLVELPSIYANKSAEENMKFQYINLGLPLDDSLTENLRFVGLDNLGKKKAGKFSLGMRQRLGIAMAMAGNPELLILDEPINGLDPQGIIAVRNLLLRLNQEKGTTIVISSHILSELSRLATRFAFIDRGQIIKESSAEEIEHAGQKIILVDCDKEEELIAALKAKDITADNKRYPGHVAIQGDINIADIAVTASENGIKVSDIRSIEPNLEDYFVNLVGGTTNV